MANMKPWVDPSTSHRNCISKPTFFLKACQENHNVHCMLPCKMVKRLRACPQPNSASCKPKSFASSSKAYHCEAKKGGLAQFWYPKGLIFQDLCGQIVCKPSGVTCCASLPETPQKIREGKCLVPRRCSESGSSLRLQIGSSLRPQIQQIRASWAKTWNGGPTHSMHHPSCAYPSRQSSC